MTTKILRTMVSGISLVLGLRTGIEDLCVYLVFRVLDVVLVPLGHRRVHCRTGDPWSSTSFKVTRQQPNRLKLQATCLAPV